MGGTTGTPDQSADRIFHRSGKRCDGYHSAVLRRKEKGQGSLGGTYLRGVFHCAGVGLMVFGIVLSRPMLALMQTPEDVIDYAVLYIRIYFIGTVPNLLYNYGAGILRAVGDSPQTSVLSDCLLFCQHYPGRSVCGRLPYGRGRRGNCDDSFAVYQARFWCSAIDENRRHVPAGVEEADELTGLC